MGSVHVIGTLLGGWIAGMLMREPFAWGSVDAVPQWERYRVFSVCHALVGWLSRSTYAAMLFAVMNPRRPMLTLVSSPALTSS